MSPVGDELFARFADRPVDVSPRTILQPLRTRTWSRAYLRIYSSNIGSWKIVATSDLNDDGIADIILQDSSSTWVGAWLVNESGHVTAFRPIYSSSIGAWKVVGAADLNGDGVSDIVLQNTSSTSVGAWLMDAADHPTSFVTITRRISDPGKFWEPLTSTATA
jgi:FG-GAP-like repeat